MGVFDFRLKAVGDRRQHFHLKKSYDGSCPSLRISRLWDVELHLEACNFFGISGMSMGEDWLGSMRCQHQYASAYVR